MKIEIFDILAITGSLAWSWPLIQWIIKQTKKAELSLSAHREVEIGYDDEGPYLVLELAFASKNQDIFVDSATLTLTHKNNQTHEFIWSSFQENHIYEDLQDRKEFPIQIQRAIALNVPQNTLIDKKIQFINDVYLNEIEYLEEQLDEILDNLKKSNNFSDKVKSSKEYNQLLNYYKDNFFWQVGEYNIELLLTTNNNLGFVYNYVFKLNSRDIRSLEKNVKLAQATTLRRFLPYYEDDNEWFVINSKMDVVN